MVLKNLYFLFLLSFGLWFPSLGNKLTVTCKANNKTLYQNDTLLISGEKFILTNWKLYLSNISINSSDSSVTENSYQLVVLTDSLNLIQGPNLSDQLKSLSFGIGVDSAKTMGGVMDGDLDPAKGMFWSWQSGYINFKVEYEDTKGKEYVFHLGGFSGKQNSFRVLSFDIPQGKTVTGIEFDLIAFIEFIKNQKLASVMSPGKKTSIIVNNYRAFFSLKFK